MRLDPGWWFRLHAIVQAREKSGRQPGDEAGLLDLHSRLSAIEWTLGIRATTGDDKFLAPKEEEKP